MAGYNGTGKGWDIPYTIAVDSSVNVYVMGRSDGQGTSLDYATIKYGQPNTYSGRVPLDVGNGVSLTFGEIFDSSDTTAILTDQGIF